MAKIFLSVNIGSASKKYALYEDERELARFHFEKEDANFEHALAYLYKSCLISGIIKNKTDITAIGMRVVAPGLYFQENRLIDATYIKKLKMARQEAPLHLVPILIELENLHKLFGTIPIIGVSDSAFSSHLPEHARRYTLPLDIAKKYEIYRYGYHGISMQSIIRSAEKIFNKIPEKIIICHLGSGASISAIKNGKCLDVSMGFTPLEGLIMGTRIGTIDAGAVIYLSQQTGWSSKKLETFFNTECGLKGLSGKTADMRELLGLEKTGDENAKLAIQSFVYSIQKYIGAYAVVLGGIDLLVFTATIGERSFIIRHKICAELEALNIHLDETKNNATVSIAAEINSATSTPKIWVIPTDEMREIKDQIIKK